ncbi:uncharacterized protein DUF2851 [Cellulophaga sp. RHA19]|uniref:DUF2851 family protein n=1 Tax=Cellulophaga sp. RHA19 TaxID=1798237 RepID=UPI000C2BF8D8|nr:DUF2851 family protein [Cellulophaga sp. RHA19]PKB43433.1 uncharacterized protein DUF2851 [Cellulophaga sp. RHA19]
MREDLLHFIWKYKKIQLKGLQTTKGDAITITSVGTHNYNEGPDFFNAQLKIGNQLWAGNVEIHINASDWYAHNHEKDKNYDNVILHVVWQEDATVFRPDNSEIPTLVLKDYIPLHILNNYKQLFSSKNQKFINCEKDVATVDSFLMQNWLDRLYFERLEQKSILIQQLLTDSNNNWEHVLFALLMKNFGSAINGESFLQLAKNIDFSVLKKVSVKPLHAESLLFGMSGLLQNDEILDNYYLELKKEYAFLAHKFNFTIHDQVSVAFFKLRPTNFPTIRLSQLCALYGKHQTLFAKLMQAKTVDQIYDLCNVVASNYWDNHYTFGKESKVSKKRLTKSFVNLLIINTILPLRFCYSKYVGKDDNENILEISTALDKEQNSIVSGFKNIKLNVQNAKDSQAVLQLYKMYCTKNKCLQCAVGSSLLSRNG